MYTMQNVSGGQTLHSKGRNGFLFQQMQTRVAVKTALMFFVYCYGSGGSLITIKGHFKPRVVPSDLKLKRKSLLVRITQRIISLIYASNTFRFHFQVLFGGVFEVFSSTTPIM